MVPLWQHSGNKYPNHRKFEDALSDASNTFDGISDLNFDYNSNYAQMLRPAFRVIFWAQIGTLTLESIILKALLRFLPLEYSDRVVYNPDNEEKRASRSWNPEIYAPEMKNDLFEINMNVF